MLGHRVREPVDLLVGLQSEDGVARLEEAGKIPHLHLKEGKVAKNLKILRIDPERLLVGLDGLVVLAIGTVEQAIHVPANVRSVLVGEEREKLVSAIEFIAKCSL